MWAVLNVVTEAAVRTPALCLLSGLPLFAAVTRFHLPCLCELVHSCPCTVDPLSLSLSAVIMCSVPCALMLEVTSVLLTHASEQTSSRDGLCVHVRGVDSSQWDGPVCSDFASRTSSLDTFMPHPPGAG